MTTRLRSYSTHNEAEVAFSVESHRHHTRAGQCGVWWCGLATRVEMGKARGTCGSRLPTSSSTGAHHGRLAMLDDACRARPKGRRVAPARRVSYRAIETGGGHPFHAKYLFAFELIRILLAMAILNSPAHASPRLGGQSWGNLPHAPSLLLARLPALSTLPRPQKDAGSHSLAALLDSLLWCAPA